jgi:hypothetical protein
MSPGPVADATGHRHPAGDELARFAHGLFCRGGHVAVGIDDQRCQQLVSAGAIAVQSRRDHAELSRYRPQRDAGHTGLGDLTLGNLLDLLGQSGPGPGTYALSWLDRHVPDHSSL